MQRKRFGFWTATALVVGNIVGAGIFMQPASLAPYGWNAVTAWVISLLGALSLAGIFARLAASYPEAGGAHGFMEMGVGSGLAFVGSWGYVVSIWSTNAALTISGISYLTRLIPALRATPGAETATAVAVIVLLTWANLRALAGPVQMISSIIKLLPFTAVIVLAAWTLFREGAASLAPIDSVPITAATTLSAIGITFYAMLGLESAAMPADAVEEPEKNVPRATIVGTTLSGVITIFSTCAVALMMPLAVVSQSKAPMADFVGSYWGDWAGVFVAFCGVVSCFGCLNGWILIGGELPAAMSKRGSLPAWFGERNAQGVPARAVVLSATVSSVLTLAASSRVGIGAFNFVALISTATTLVLYLFCTLTAVRFMRDGRLRRTPGLVLCAVGALLFVAGAFYGSGSETLLWGAGLMLLGWPLRQLALRAVA
ncbi:MAG: amino acid permease [Gemmatimonadaceae bacterium]|nr:amino acid permease [Gemmatimonadaceae bacterium]